LTGTHEFHGEATRLAFFVLPTAFDRAVEIN
jgi:hypothetical protein